MSVDQMTSLDVESQRRDAIAERQAESGSDWDRGFEPGTAGGHELLDRVHLVLDMLERHVLDHPACLRDASWFEQAARAAELLRELYQRIGAA